MKHVVTAVVVSLLAYVLPADAQQAEPAPIPALDLSAKSPSATPVLTDEIIKKAVRETIAEEPHPPPAANQQAGVLRAGTVSMEERMSAAFDDAKVPDCLHGDALKLQPAYIGPIAVGGLLSLPWIVAAAARGKCR
ncbi:hypothetical protein GTP46_16960 [Duganella sp. FT135W]|uniref:Secreted protein n=1 Tax=Duganella flavida TaxID=2692175 RepID=A0A6L8KCD7_9BURK|nr:hypothetical protein [Duganella flavida]MYM24337.1 hypothetical protein [Duganella flavida]